MNSALALSTNNTALATWITCVLSTIPPFILFVIEYVRKPMNLLQVFRGDKLNALCIVIEFLHSFQSDAPWWGWTAGVVGYLFVLALTFLTPTLGAAVLLGTILSTQILSAAIFDHFGWMGLSVKRTTWVKMAGIFVVLIGVVMLIVL